MKANNTDTTMSTQGQEVKKPYMMPIPENAMGNESGVSDTAGLGAVAKQYSGPTGNNGINGDYSTENRAAQFKNPQAKQDEGAGANQY